jgi:hypothetical protein
MKRLFNLIAVLVAISMLLTACVRRQLHDDRSNNPAPAPTQPPRSCRPSLLRRLTRWALRQMKAR